MVRSDTLNYIAERFQISLDSPSPIHIEKSNRPIMADCLKELGFNVGVEVGVAEGFHSEILLDGNPNLELYCVDPWHKEDGYHSYHNMRLKTFETVARDKLSRFGDRVHFVKDISMSAVHNFEDQSLDFVYIDGAHDFRHIAEDISEWILKIKPGGILYGHDFTTIVSGRWHCHVEDVVIAYAKSHLITPFFVLGQEGKPDGLYKQGELAWMYVC